MARQPLPTAITPSTRPGPSLSGQVPAGNLTWGLGGPGPSHCLRSLEEGKKDGLDCSRSPGVSCDQRTQPLSPWLRLLLLLPPPAGTQG